MQLSPARCLSVFGAALLTACASAPAPILSTHVAGTAFESDTILVEPLATGTYAGTTVSLNTAAWRKGQLAADSTATVKWTTHDGDLSHGWVADDGTLVLLRPGRLRLTAEWGIAHTDIELKVRDNPVRRVELLRADSGVVEPGDTVRFVARAMSDEGKPIVDVAVHYALSSRGLPGTDHANVDDEGRFVASEPGVYTLIAAVGTVSAQGVVHVSGSVPHVRRSASSALELEIQEPEYQPYAGTSLLLKASARDASGRNARVEQVRWTSSDSSIALVDQRGVVAFVRDGKVQITATAGEESASRTYSVREDAAAHMAFTIGASDIVVGEEIPLRDALWQKGGIPIRDARVNYGIVFHGGSSHAGAARVTEDREFVASEPGVYTLIAELGGFAEQHTIVVRAPNNAARVSERR
jgi:hypothetical protein